MQKHILGRSCFISRLTLWTSRTKSVATSTRSFLQRLSLPRFYCLSHLEDPALLKPTSYYNPAHHTISTEFLRPSCVHGHLKIPRSDLRQPSINGTFPSTPNLLHPRMPVSRILDHDREQQGFYIFHHAKRRPPHLPDVRSPRIPKSHPINLNYTAHLFPSRRNPHTPSSGWPRCASSWLL